MKYFELKQDTRMPSRFSIESLDWQVEKKVGIVYFKGEEENLPDFINYNQYHLVSRALKAVIEMYTEQVSFKIVILNNLDLIIQKEYYSLEADVIEGLSKATTYYKNGWIDKKVFSQEKIEGYQVFRLEELTKSPLFIHLDCVESILRRDLWGMSFEDVIVQSDVLGKGL